MAHGTDSTLLARIEQLEQLLGTELGAVTDQTFPWAEPLKLRKVTGRVARIEMFRYAHQCDGDGMDWELVDGSVGRSEVEGVPGPASRSGMRGATRSGTS